jgi:hypothetical protein
MKKEKGGGERKRGGEGEGGEKEAKIYHFMI